MSFIYRSPKSTLASQIFSNDSIESISSRMSNKNNTPTSDSATSAGREDLWDFPSTAYVGDVVFAIKESRSFKPVDSKLADCLADRIRLWVLTYDCGRKEVTQ